MARGSERTQQRKIDRLIEHTHGGYAGRSILEMLIEQLDRAVERHLTIQDSGLGNPPSMSASRGEVRGLARAVAIMQNPYQPDHKNVEREAAQRVREYRGRTDQAEA